MYKHCNPSVLVFDKAVWEVTRFRCNHENGACLMNSMRRDSLNVWSLSTMQGHVRRLKSTTQGIPSSQELTIWAPAFWAFSFNNCETMLSNLSYFVFWATKYEFPGFAVTFAYLEISLHLSTSDFIRFWKVLLGYGTIGLLSMCVFNLACTLNLFQKFYIWVMLIFSPGPGHWGCLLTPNMNLRNHWSRSFLPPTLLLHDWIPAWGEGQWIMLSPALPTRLRSSLVTFSEQQIHSSPNLSFLRFSRNGTLKSRWIF